MYDSNLSSSVRAKLNMTTQSKISLMRQDIDDTLINQINALQFFYDCYSADVISDIDAVNEVISSDAATQIFTDYNGKYVNFINQNTQYSIKVDSVSESIKVNKLTSNGVVYIGDILHKDNEGNYVLSSSILDSSGNEILNVSDSVMSEINDQIACTEVISNLAMVASNCDYNDPDALLTKFNNTVSSYTDSSEASSLISDIKQTLAQTNSSSTGALQILTDLYQNLSEFSIDSSGDIQLNNAKFKVSGFIGSSGIKLIAQTATLVVTAVLAAINPIVGMIGYGVLQVASSVNSYWKSQSTDASFDDTSENNLYAQPIFSKSGAYPSSGVVKGYLDNLFAASSDYGSVVTIPFPHFDILLWKSSDSTILYCEIYAKVRRTNISLSLYNALRCMIDNNNDIYSGNNYVYGTWHIYYPQAVGSKYNCYAYYMTDNAYAQTKVLGDNSDNTFKMTSSLALYDVANDIFVLTVLLHNSSVDGIHLSGQRDASDVDSLNDLLIWSTEDYRGVGNNTWSGLVNNLIPKLNTSNWFCTSFEDFISKLFNFLIEMDDQTLESSYENMLNTYAPELCDNNHDYCCPVYYLPDRYKCYVYPPNITPWAKFKTIMAVVGITLAATAVIATIAKTKAVIRKHNARKYLEVQRAQSQLINNTNPSLDDALFNDYYSKLKRYNRFSSFAGRSKLSTISGWEVGDSASPSKSSGVISSVVSDAIANRQDIITSDNINTQSIINKVIELIKGSN